MRNGPAVLLGMLAVTLGACRSPFEPYRDTAEDDVRVGRGVHAWPIFERAPGETGTRTDILWPVASLRTDAAGTLTSAEIVYPFGHYLSTPTRSEFGLRPLFEVDTEPASESNPDGVTDVWAVLRLFEWKDAGAEHLRRALIVQSDEKPGHDGFHVFPFWWHTRDPDESVDHLWPIYGVHREGTFTKRWILAPLFSWEDDPARQATAWDAFFPLFHRGSDKDGTHVRALPLFWQTFSPGSKATVLFPFWWDFEDAKSSFRLLLPFYGHQQRGEEFERSVYGGFLWMDTRDGTKRSTDIAWPLVGWTTSDDPKVSSWHVAPVLFFGQDGDTSSWSHVFPFFGTWTWAGRTQWYAAAGLVAHGESEETSTWNFVGPFIQVESGGNGFDHHVFPLFSASRSGSRSEGNIGVWLLADWERDEDRQTGSFGILPFGMLLRGAWDDRTDTSDWGVLWRLVHSAKSEHKSVFAFNPLYRHETNDRGDDFWSLLFGMVARKQEAGEVNWRLLWVL